MGKLLVLLPSSGGASKQRRGRRARRARRIEGQRPHQSVAMSGRTLRLGPADAIGAPAAARDAAGAAANRWATSADASATADVVAVARRIGRRRRHARTVSTLQRLVHGLNVVYTQCASHLFFFPNSFDTFPSTCNSHMTRKSFDFLNIDPTQVHSAPIDSC